MNKEREIPEFVLKFKKYKSKTYKLDFDEIISFLNSENEDNCKFCKKTLLHPNFSNPLGVLPINYWSAYSIIKHDGLIVISNVFTESFQKFIIVRALENYIMKPNESNIGNSETIWQNYKSDPVGNIKSIKKLRWSTLGYHHNWNTKVYDLLKQSSMPKELFDVCKYIASALGYDDYNAEAAIVNFYHEGNTLAGHTDHSEQDLLSPIISFSFGCSAIFMIGGLTKEDASSAILVNSGDVVVMSRSARSCYHAVPKILVGTFNGTGNELNINNQNQLTKPKLNNFNLPKELKCDQMSSIDMKNELYEVGENVNANLNQVQTINSENEYEDLTMYYKFYGDYNEQISESVEDSQRDVKRFKLDDNELLKDADLNRTEWCCNWSIYKLFLLNSRININIRQVMLK